MLHRRILEWVSHVPQISEYRGGSDGVANVLDGSPVLLSPAIFNVFPALVQNIRDPFSGGKDTPALIANDCFGRPRLAVVEQLSVLGQVGYCFEGFFGVALRAGLEGVLDFFGVRTVNKDGTTGTRVCYINFLLLTIFNHFQPFSTIFNHFQPVSTIFNQFPQSAILLN